jgi:phosphatidate phosphatase APP1
MKPIRTTLSKKTPDFPAHYFEIIHFHHPAKTHSMYQLFPPLSTCTSKLRFPASSLFYRPHDKTRTYLTTLKGQTPMSPLTGDTIRG